MLPLVLAVFVASVLGSGHCVGMCGAFVAFAVTADVAVDGEPGGSRAAARATPWRRRSTLNAAYNLGRLATYALLGAVAGVLGAAMDLGGAALGVQRAALGVAGAFMIGFACVALARALGARLPGVPLPGALRRAVTAGHRAAFALPPAGRAAAIGVLTPLLPCGWLYAFVVTAAGTGSPWFGAAVMAVFWLGTVPALAALGLGAHLVGAPLRRRLPALTAVLLATVGVWTLVGRSHVPALDAMVRTAAPASPGSDGREAVERVQSLDVKRMPCCEADASAKVASEE